MGLQKNVKLICNIITSKRFIFKCCKMFSWSSALNNIVKITRHKLFLKPLQWAYSLRDIKNRGLKKSSFFSRMFYKWNTRYFKTYKAIATYTAPKEFSILGFFYFQNPDRLTMIEVIMWLQQHHSFQNKPVRGKKKVQETGWRRAEHQGQFG